MKTWKLVSGIFSMILFVLVAFQSCTAGMVNALEDNGESSGSVGILILTGGIVSAATRISCCRLCCLENVSKEQNIDLLFTFQETA